MTPMQSGDTASTASQPQSDRPKASTIIIAAALGAAERLLSDVANVGQDESAMLVTGLEALLKRLFGHHKA